MTELNQDLELTLDNLELSLENAFKVGLWLASGNLAVEGRIVAAKDVCYNPWNL